MTPVFSRGRLNLMTMILSMASVSCMEVTPIEQDAGVDSQQRSLAPCEDGEHNGGDGYCYPLTECAPSFTLEETGYCARFSPAPALLPARWQNGAAKLDNRYVMFCGGLSGDSVLDETILFDEDQEIWVNVNRMPHAVHGHALTRYEGNQVLVAGGVGDDEEVLANTMLFRGDIGDWIELAPLTVGRTHHGLEYTASGRIFVFGGLISGGSTTTRIEEFVNDEWIELDSQLRTHRSSMETVLLQDGRIMIVGGLGQFGETKSSAEILDPTTALSELTDSMTDERAGHSAILIDDSRVLVVGGYVLIGETTNALRTAEIYDVETGLWSDTGFLRTPRYGHAMVALEPGVVMVFGGFSDEQTPLRTTEVYDVQEGVFLEGASMEQARAYFSASLLHDGRVLLANGVDNGEDLTSLSSAELYEAAR